MEAPLVPTIEELLRHARWIEELARRLVRDPAVADDLAQSAWVIALRDRDRPHTDLRGWIARVLRNLARERHRREAQRVPVELQGARHEALPSPEALLERAEAERALVECVMRLEEPHRATLLLRYFEGLSSEDIARREGVSPAAVAHRITRAHAHLRERLQRTRSGPWFGALLPILGRERGAWNQPDVPHDSTPENAIREQELSMKVLPMFVAAGLVVAVAAFVLSRKSDEAENQVVAKSEAVPAPLAVDAPVEADVERASATTPVASVAPPTPVEASAPSVATEVQPSRLHGRVFRPDGSPASKRKVRLLQLVATHGKSQGEQYVECDERGAFDAPGISAGTWSVATWPDEAEITGLGMEFEGTLMGMAYLAERTLDLANGRDYELLLGVPPEKPIHVRGRVVRDGAEVELQAVQWLPAGEGTYDLKKNARTIEGRAYETVLEKPGRYHVTASLPGARPEWTIDVPDVRELELDLEVPPNVVLVRVVDEQGEPVKNASVELAVRGGRRAPLLFSSLAFRGGTDAEGGLRFHGLDAADYVVTVHGGKLGAEKEPGAVVVSATIRARAEKEAAAVELVLSPGRMVPLRVLDGEREVQSPLVFLFDARGEPLNASSGATRGKAGELTTLPLAPGRYSAVAAAGKHWSKPREFTVTAEGDLERVELALEPACELVVDARAHPRALVEVVDDAGRKFGALVDKARFNRAIERNWDSDLPVLRLPMGNYTVKAVGVDSARASVRVALLGPGSTRVELAP